MLSKDEKLWDDAVQTYFDGNENEALIYQNKFKAADDQGLALTGNYATCYIY